MLDESIENINIKKIIYTVSSEPKVRELRIWFDNQYFEDMKYSWINDEIKIEALLKLMVRLTQDCKYTRRGMELLYDGIEIGSLRYEGQNEIALTRLER